LFELPPSNPLTLGDIVGKAIRLFRTHYIFFVRVFLVPCLMLQLSLMYVTSTLERFSRLLRSDHAFEPATFVVFFGNLLAALAILSVGFFIKTVRQVAVIRMVVQAPIPYSDALQFAREKKWLAFVVHAFFTLGVLAILIGWLVLAAAIVTSLRATQISGVVTSILLGFVGLGLTFSISWFSLFEVLALSVLSCETLSLAAYWKRTWALAWPYLWRGGSFVCILFTAIALISLAGELPVALTGAMTDTFRKVQQIPALHDLPPGGLLLIEACGHVWEGLVTILTTGIGVTASALYYRDVRLRLEGDDILQKIEALKSVD
jgi:hypothetical protein